MSDPFTLLEVPYPLPCIRNKEFNQGFKLAGNDGVPESLAAWLSAEFVVNPGDTNEIAFDMASGEITKGADGADDVFLIQLDEDQTAALEPGQLRWIFSVGATAGAGNAKIPVAFGVLDTTMGVS